MSLINREINLILTWSENCFITIDPDNNQLPTFPLTGANLYVRVVIFLTQNNAKLLQQTKSGLKRTINWNKYRSKVTIWEPKQYWDYLIDPSFQGMSNGMKRNDFLFYHLKRILVEQFTTNILFLKDHNFMVNEQHFLDQPAKNDLRTYPNIWKIATGQEDDYKSDCLLDYPCFKEHCKMITTDLSKQHALDGKVIQQINFTGNLD